MREIPLTRGQVALVDDEDYGRLAAFKWHFGGLGYATGQPDGVRCYMHRFILQAGPKQAVDHINRNRLDNRRGNMRFATQRQNTFNQRPKGKLGIKGVSAHCGQWRARIMVNRIEIQLGTFKTIEEAARAYDAAAVSHFGDHAYLNFPIYGQEARA